MKLSRRAVLAASAAAPALASPMAMAVSLPATNAFPKMTGAYFNSSSIHPLPLGAKAALMDYMTDRHALLVNDDFPERRKKVIAAFGKLVGASPDELMVTQSTTMAENLIIRALGLPAGGGRIVTDALHFTGSFYMYSELGKAGMDVVTLPMTKDGRIGMDALDAALNKKTKLVSVSVVSATNGFEHDLKRVCDAAHAHGALVYAEGGDRAGRSARGGRRFRGQLLLQISDGRFRHRLSVCAKRDAGPDQAPLVGLFPGRQGSRHPSSSL